MVESLTFPNWINNGVNTEIKPEQRYQKRAAQGTLSMPIGWALSPKVFIDLAKKKQFKNEAAFSQICRRFLKAGYCWGWNKE